MLAALGADAFPHVSGSLAGHLCRTSSLLAQWGARAALCAAGRFHAVYGTDGIEGELLAPTERSRVAATIGDEAERVAYLYGACTRDRYHPRLGTDAESRFVDRFTATEYPIVRASLHDFCELTLANELELARSSPAFRVKHGVALAELASRMHPHVSPAALAACAETLPWHRHETRSGRR